MHYPEGAPRRLGEVLVAEGKISEAQLRHALELQSTDRRSLGKILVSLGYIGTDDLARALAKRLKIEYVSLSEESVDPGVRGIIGEEALRRHCAVPLRVENGRLVVAMSDPNDLDARSGLAVSAGYPITPVIADESAIAHLQSTLFGDEAPRETAEGPQERADEEGAETVGKLGEILVAEGKLSEEELQEALRAQAVEPQNLGTILVSRGYVSAEDVARALARRMKLDFVSVSDLPDGAIDWEALALVDEETLRRHMALPLRFEDGRLVVAMSDPNDIYALEDLHVIAKRPITPVVTTEEDLRAAFDRFLNGSSGPGAVMEPREPYGSDRHSEGSEDSVQIDGKPSDVPGGELVVLIADDESISRAIARRAVEKLGHQTVLAEDGLRAWELYRRHPEIDVVISDWMMPGLDGIELCRRIRRSESDKRTFFIFLTALSGEQHLMEGMEAGADEYLTKPLNSEQLRAKLDDALKVRSFHEHLWEPAARPDEDRGDGADSESRTLPARGRRGGVRTNQVWEVLISEGKLSEDQLQRALEVQKTDPRDLGQILLSLGYITKTDLARATATRLRLDFVELSEQDVDRGVASMIEQKVLRRHKVMPLRIENGRLIVAMSDPTNIPALEDLSMISGYRIKPVVALEEEIQRVFNKVFAISEEVTGMLEEAAGDSEAEELGEIELGGDVPADEAPIIRLVGSILQQAVGEGASDIHIEPRARELTVRFRVDGVLREVMSIPPKLQSGVTARIKILADLNIAERRVPQDGRFSVRLGGQKVDLRVASLPTVYGEKLVLRLLDTATAAVDLTELGFRPEVYEKYEEIFRRPYGAILVTGPTGSGKSTTLYATLNELNTPEKNIITVEDPVEYRIRGINQIQTNPKIGLTFASALRSILRADPDIVMIGEIRDRETAKIAVEAALTGHLVLATLHTNNAPGALSRLTDMGVEPFLTSSAVDCVIAQRLARRLCEHCKEPVEIEKEILAGMNFPFQHFPDGDFAFHKAVGCNRCGGSGYRGRVGVYEMMVVTEEIRELVMRRVPTDEIARAAGREGMVRLRDDGLMKAARGITTLEEVLRTVV